MKKTITWGASVGMLLLTGAANASFTDLGTDPNNWIYTTSTTTPTANNLEGINTFYQQTPDQDPMHQLVQFSGGGLLPNRDTGGLGFIDNQVDPLNLGVGETVDQVTLFANDAGSLLDGVIDQFTHTDFYLLNDTSFDFTISFAWEIINGDGLSLFTNPFGPNQGDPLADPSITQLNTGIGVESGVFTLDVLSGDYLGFSLLTNTLDINGAPTAFFPNDAYASIFDLVIDDARPVDVPEPGTLLLLAAGLVGIGVSRRKQKTC